MLTIVKFIRKIKTEGLEKIGFIPFLYDYWFRGSRVRQYIGYLRRPKIVIDSLSCQNLSKILDVGCDWGYMAKLLDLKGFSAYGLDINLGSLIFGKRILKEHWSPPILICGTGINLPFKDNSFETIISLETIEHIQLEKRKIFLFELKRCVKKGGQIILTTPNKYGITEIGKQIMAKIPVLKKKCGITKRIKKGGHMEGFPASQTMIDFPVSAQELKDMTGSLNLRLIRQANTIFITKLCPESCLGLAILIEGILERIPLIKAFGATSLFIFKK